MMETSAQEFNITWCSVVIDIQAGPCVYWGVHVREVELVGRQLTAHPHTHTRRQVYTIAHS